MLTVIMESNWFSIIFLLVLLVFTVNSKIVRHTFDISYVSGQPDGVWTKSILGINGKFPGPTIEAEVGDVLEVTMINNIHDGQNVTIHWHGLHQRGNQFQDGPSQITQCPLRRGSTQVYRFPLVQSGTYWYHSHVNSQYSEGLWGTLIVRRTPETWRDLYDAEILVTVNDWYHTSAKENEEWFLRPDSRGAPPYPFSVLMNGVGRYPCDRARPQSRLCDAFAQKRPVFHLQANKIYRLRLVSTSGWVAFNFTVEGHRLRPIEVDGVDLAMDLLVPPADLPEAVFIGAGQRYSLILVPKAGVATTGSEFLMRAELRREFLFTREENINAVPDALISEVTGVIHYAAENPALDNVNVAGGEANNHPLIRPLFESFDHFRSYVPAQPWSDLRFLNEMTLRPYDGILAPPQVDTNVVLTIQFENDFRGIRYATFNGRPFRLTSGKPMLGKFVDGELIPPESNPFYIPYGVVVQVIINNPRAGPHPIHLHGHHFWVVGMGRTGDGPYDPVRDTLDFGGHRRDTVMVKEKSWLVIRFLADNPGVWTLHCHIDWHNLSGMAMTFVEASQFASTLVIPEEAIKVCAEHNVTLSSNAFANRNRTPGKPLPPLPKRLAPYQF
ncbi:unnamed protein product [Orchesella dallaii]|uniref:Uncharacterized protein n=1 Tax=Orchesella dallaii TaxID=48710 RepID=A0ABP1QQC8_9HEXA